MNINICYIIGHKWEYRSEYYSMQYILNRNIIKVRQPLLTSVKICKRCWLKKVKNDQIGYWKKVDLDISEIRDQKISKILSYNGK